MRRLVLLLALAVALTVPAAAHGAAVLVFNGQGWGHGVGLAQYGARGFAERDGWAYDRILAHYYPGTALGPGPSQTVRVLLADGRKTLAIGSSAQFTVVDSAGVKASIPAVITVDTSFIVAGKQLAPPIRFRAGKAPLELNGRTYRGDLVVHAAGSALAVVNEVGLEQYLYGVVPHEMPAGWASEALKAQAVAARSFALATRKLSGIYDVFVDTRSQAYGGASIEDPRTTAAVDATAGLVVLWNGTPAMTVYSSTSGGRTAAAKDVWGSDLPYLRPVEDPHDDLSPYHTWGPVVLTARKLARLLGGQAPGGLRDAVVEPDSSGRVGALGLVGARATASVPGTAVRTLLGLRSTWFEVGVLSLLPGRSLVVVGAKAMLTGVVRGVEGVLLERRVAGGWKPVRKVKPRADGTFSVAVPGDATAVYRLAAPDLAGPSVRVVVSGT